MRHLPSAQLVTALAIAVLTCCGAGCGGTTKTIIEVRTPAALQAPALAPYRVPSASMEPTLAIGETVWVQAIEQLAPQVGDIVIFNPPKNAEQQICGPTPHMVTPGGAACATPEPEPASVKFVKRIVAGPSDTLYIKEGHVYINGKRESDPYITPCGAASECNFPTPIKVSAGHWFLMGDNRGESDDSRFWGPVPASWIIGLVRWCGALDVSCPTG